MLHPENCTCLPVGGIPRVGDVPVWTACHVQCAIAVSPSTTSSWMVDRVSVKADSVPSSLMQLASLPTTVWKWGAVEHDLIRIEPIGFAQVSLVPRVFVHLQYSRFHLFGCHRTSSYFFFRVCFILLDPYIFIFVIRVAPGSARFPLPGDRLSR